jgi:MFS family permease
VRPPRKLWALGAVAFSCLLIEGATADWSAVYLRNHTEATAAAAALGFTAFSVTMTAGRLLGDRLTERFGPRALVRGGGLLAAAGFGVALVLDSPAAGIAGFAFVGAGMAAVVPVVFRAAGGIDGITAGVGIAAVSSMGYLGFMAGPPAIGGVAELTGLPVSLSLLVLLAAVVALLAAATEPRTRRAHAVREEPCAEVA